MTRTYINILVLTLLTALFVGCSGYNKVLKSKDPELKYRTALDYYQQEKYKRTTLLLEDVIHVFNGTEKDDSAHYYLAVSYFKDGDLHTSSTLMDAFRKTFTNSPFLEDIECLYAKGFYFLSPAPNRDQNSTNKAIIAIGEYLDRYPNSVKREELIENTKELYQKLHDKSFINAKSYYTTGRYKSAIVALNNAKNRFPTSSHREEIMYLIVKSGYLLASNSYESLMRERYIDMIDNYYSFALEYPDSDHMKELTKMHKTAKEYLDKFQDGEQIDTESSSALN